MLKFKGHFEKLSIDERRLRKDFGAALLTQVKQASREFLRAVIDKVPVHTGMSRGGLRPLGRLLRMSIPIDPLVRSKDKSPAKGDIRSLADLDDSDPFRPSIKLNIDIAHYQENELQTTKRVFSGDGVLRPGTARLKNPVPWKSFEAGRKAFREYLRNNLKRRLPKIKDFVVRTRVEIR